MESLIKFVKQKFDTDNFTHVLGISNKNFPFILTDKDISEFWNLTMKCNSDVVVRERFKNINKVVVSIDHSHFDELSIKKIVLSLQLAVFSIFNVKNNNILTTITHQEKNKLTLIMPFCHVEYSTLRKELIDVFIQVLDERKVLSNSHYSLINKKMYDTVFWITRPIENLLCYPNLTTGLIEQTDGFIIENILGEKYKNVYSILSFYSDEQETKRKNTNKKNKQNILLNKIISNHTEDKFSSRCAANKIKSYSYLSELLVFLDLKRCNKHDEFLDIGQCLFNITDGNKEGLSFWEDISKNSNKSKLCSGEWLKFKKTDINIGTLKYWCSSDNPVQYAQWNNKSIRNLVWNSLSPESSYTDIAEILYRKYEHKFICLCENSKLIWYQYKNNRYIRHGHDTAIRIKLSTEIVNEFNIILNECDMAIAETCEDIEKQKWMTKRLACIQVIKNLKNPEYKSSVMKEASEKFNHYNFTNNKMYFCFDNGIFDCNSCSFRESRPQDYVTITCGYNYEHYTWDHPDVVFCIDYLKKVFVNNELREYFIRFCSSCLEGGNNDKIVPIFTGTGNNSKSIIEFLLQKCFGDYFLHGPLSIIVDEQSNINNSSSKFKNARLILFHEPILDNNVNESFKALFSTKLFSSSKCSLVCNSPLFLDSNNPYIANTLRVISFKSLFTDICPSTSEEQFEKHIFPIDFDFQNKIPSMIKPFMWILTQEYINYKKYGLATPQIVINDSSAYCSSNDFFKEFIAEKIVVEPDIQKRNTVFIKSDQLYQTFRLWFKDNYPSCQVPNSADIKYRMVCKGYEIKALRYYGLALKYQ